MLVSRKVIPVSILEDDMYDYIEEKAKEAGNRSRYIRDLIKSDMKKGCTLDENLKTLIDNYLKNNINNIISPK